METRGRMVSFSLAALATAIVAAGAARADAIDGDWCDAAGKTLSIRGPRIVTPGGKELDGRYDRHGFAYVVPADEPGAGGTVEMRLLNEQTVALRPHGAAEPQIWKRCALKVS